MQQVPVTINKANEAAECQWLGDCIDFHLIAGR